MEGRSILNITRGRISKPKKVVIYGTEGIGKSTFASQFPDPLFIDTEGSTRELDVARFDPPTSWAMVKSQIAYVIKYPDVCKTLVIDTADWAERLMLDSICNEKGWDGLEGAGYGKGYTYAAEEFGKFLNLLSEVVDKGVHVVLTAHAEMKKVELPEEMGSYDHWAMKTSKKVSHMIREWADMVLFANYKVNVVNVDGQGAVKGRNKAQGGRRVMYTTHTPFWDAKNRYGLPDELPFNFDAIREIFSLPDRDPVPTAVPPVKDIPPVQDHAANAQQEEPQVLPKSSDKPEEEKKSAGKPVQTAGNVKQHTVPAVVTDENLDKRIPKALRDLMITDSIDAWDLANVVQIRLPGTFPMDMEVKDYPQDFIDEWVLPNWQHIVDLVHQERDRMAIPFN